MSEKALRIGTRGSPLASWQADWVAGKLRAQGIDVQIIPIKTKADASSGSIQSFATQGVFTKEIQQALLDDRIDLAVHSLKDLPTEAVAGLTLAAVPTREASGDALVCRRVHQTLDTLPHGARIGTGSRRRQAQLLAYRPDLKVEDMRGNVDTRVMKLDSDECDALVLAEAGLRRLGLADRIAQIIPKQIMLPAVGQGALGLEIRQDDQPVRDAIGFLDDHASHQAVMAERSLLAELRGGCLAPIGAWGRMVEQTLQLDAVVLSLDGKTRISGQVGGPIGDAVQLGAQLAGQLRQQGAQRLIEAVR